MYHFTVRGRETAGVQSTLKVLEGLDILKAFHTLLSTRHMKTLLNNELWRIQSAQSVARAIV